MTQAAVHSAPVTAEFDDSNLAATRSLLACGWELSMRWEASASHRSLKGSLG
jgi:hypothetical protein